MSKFPTRISAARRNAEALLSRSKKQESTLKLEQEREHDAMLEKTLRLCEAAHGNFLTYDGELFHQAAFRGEPQFAEYRRQQGPLRPAEIGQLARVVQGGGTLHRIDTREDEAYRDDPAFRQNVDGLGIRTSLTVPLRKGDALLGRALGRVLAHEVVHILSKSGQHGTSGVARTALSGSQLIAPELRLEPEDLDRINLDRISDPASRR